MQAKIKTAPEGADGDLSPCVITIPFAIGIASTGKYAILKGQVVHIQISETAGSQYNPERRPFSKKRGRYG